MPFNGLRIGLFFLNLSLTLHNCNNDNDSSNDNKK